MANDPLCNCGPATPFRDAKKNTLTENNCYPWDPDGSCPTRSGHQPGCPCDVQSYKPGEWYGNYPLVWAQEILIPKSNGMLIVGALQKSPQEKDTPEIIGVCQAKEYVGLYRKD